MLVVNVKRSALRGKKGLFFPSATQTEADRQRTMENLTSGEQTEGITAANEPLALFSMAWKCELCRQIFPDFERFIKHSNRFDQEDMRDEAGKNLITEKMSMAVILSSYACEFCDACFSEKWSLFKHQGQHTCSYECKFCNEGFPMLKAVLEHRAQCSAYRNGWRRYQRNVRVTYSCNVCTELFFTLPELYNHRYSKEHFFPRRIPTLGCTNSDIDELRYICEICGYFCKGIHTLLQHRNKEHSVKASNGAGAVELPPITEQFMCEKCGKIMERGLSCAINGCNYQTLP